MPLPAAAALPALLAGLKTAAPYIGSFLSSSAGQAALGAGGSYLGNKLFGRGGQNQMDPRMQAEQNLLQQMQQPYEYQPVDFGNIENRAREQFNLQTVPQIISHLTRLGGGGRSSALRSQLGMAGSDLESQLAGLRQQHEVGQQQERRFSYGTDQARQSALGNYLSGQQNLGQRQYEFNKSFPLDVFGRGLQKAQFGADYRQATNPLYGYQKAFGASTGQPMENVYQPGKQGFITTAGKYAYPIAKGVAGAYGVPLP